MANRAGGIVSAVARLVLRRVRPTDFANEPFALGLVPQVHGRAHPPQGQIDNGHAEPTAPLGLALLSTNIPMPSPKPPHQMKMQFARTLRTKLRGGFGLTDQRYPNFRIFVAQIVLFGFHFK